MPIVGGLALLFTTVMTEPNTALALPPPPPTATATEVNVDAGAVKLDSLGPMVVNSDGVRCFYPASHNPN